MRIPILLALLAVLALPAPCWATMWIVDGSGAAPVVGVDFYGNTAKNSTHQTVAAALSAVVGGGVVDTVFVRDGSYTISTLSTWNDHNILLVGQSQSGVILNF